MTHNGDVCENCGEFHTLRWYEGRLICFACREERQKIEEREKEWLRLEKIQKIEDAVDAAWERNR